MGSIIRLLLIDEASIVLLFRIFKFGFIHPKVPGKITGIILGIWRFEVQLILGFWDKEKQEAMYHA
tara:strand:- start:3546 stop:3743 length:198 start_codon:yes stop_codon:yes gene_type:complete